MIAALIASSMCVTGLSVNAQDKTNTPPAGAHPTVPANRGQMNMGYIAQQLSLSEEQKGKVKPILEDMQKKMVELRKDKSIEPADRRAKMKEIREATTSQLKEVLTPEQLAKWNSLGQGTRRQPTPGAGPGDAPKPQQ